MSERDAELLESDETLGDGLLPALPADARAARELLRQRTMHGLLRALWSADAETRAARIDRILAALPARRRTLLAMPRVLVAAAAVLCVWAIAVAVGSGSAGSPLPSAGKLLAETRDLLDDPVDRHFEIEVWTRTPGGKPVLQGDHTLIVRPDHRFLVEWRGLLGHFDLGCDGETIWYASKTDPAERWSKPRPEAAEVEKLLERYMGFRLGWVDVEELFARLPADRLRAVGWQPPLEPGGSRLVRLEARELGGLPFGRVGDAVVLVEPDTGMVVRCELDVVELLGVSVRIRWQYVGTVAAAEPLYRRPW